MKGKPALNKNKFLLALVALFTMLMCVSVGFASWLTTGAGTSTNTNGNIGADDYVETTGGDAYCISNMAINPFRYAQGCGFVNEETESYASSITLTGTFTFNVSEARTAINSLGGSRTFSLKIELTTSMTSNFTYTSLTFTGFTNSPVSKTGSSTATAYAVYNITLTETENSQTTLSLGFSITMTFGGTLSNFPSLSTATYQVAITPDEVIS